MLLTYLDPLRLIHPRELWRRRFQIEQILLLLLHCCRQCCLKMKRGFFYYYFVMLEWINCGSGMLSCELLIPMCISAEPEMKFMHITETETLKTETDSNPLNDIWSITISALPNVFFFLEISYYRHIICESYAILMLKKSRCTCTNHTK